MAAADEKLILIGRHAEDVGGRIVEPGQPLGPDVDPGVLERLKAEELVAKPKTDKES